MGYRKGSVYLIGTVAGFGLGYLLYLREKRRLKDLDLKKYIPKYPYLKLLKDIDLTKYFKIIFIAAGGLTGLGVAGLLDKYGPSVVSTLLDAIPTIAYFLKKNKKLSKFALKKLQELQEIIDLRKQIREKTAMNMLNDPNLTDEGIINMCRSRFEKVKKMISGPQKMKSLFALISLITFIILSNTVKFSPLIKTLRDLVREANLNENDDAIPEFDTEHNNTTLWKIILELIKGNQNSSHLEDDDDSSSFDE